MGKNDNDNETTDEERRGKKQRGSQGDATKMMRRGPLVDLYVWQSLFQSVLGYFCEKRTIMYSNLLQLRAALA